MNVMGVMRGCPSCCPCMVVSPDWLMRMGCPATDTPPIIVTGRDWGKFPGMCAGDMGGGTPSPRPPSGFCPGAGAGAMAWGGLGLLILGGLGEGGGPAPRNSPLLT